MSRRTGNLYCHKIAVDTLNCHLENRDMKGHNEYVLKNNDDFKTIDERCFLITRHSFDNKVQFLEKK